ncbi:hypothetical protein NKI48_33030 [Mesorhizobium sp. M0644]|uniref:hypothetical protein n=1 Tax=unclassified Mesorhizobium TaxID=325217 RepID=UPI003337D348
MNDKPATTYIVSLFEKPYWRTVLTTKDKAKAEAMLKEIGEGARIEAPNHLAATAVRQSPASAGFLLVMASGKIRRKPR